MWRSGTRLIARRPCPAEPSSAMVPVSAHGGGAAGQHRVEAVQRRRRRSPRRAPRRAAPSRRAGRPGPATPGPGRERVGDRLAAPGPAGPVRPRPCSPPAGRRAAPAPARCRARARRCAGTPAAPARRWRRHRARRGSGPAQSPGLRPDGGGGRGAGPATRAPVTRLRGCAATTGGRSPSAGAGRSRVAVQADSGGGSVRMRPRAGRAAGPARMSRSAARNRFRAAITQPAAAIATASGEGIRAGPLLDVAGAQVHQQRRDVDAHRAGVEAGAAQGGRVRQGRVLLDAGQLWAEHGADRARVDRAVGVPAGAFVHRADVEAGAAPDAVQRAAADLVGQRGGPAVVEQHEVELLRPVAGRHPGPHRGVRVHPLAGRRAGQQLQEHLEVGPGRHQLLDAHHGDEGLAAGSGTSGRCPRTRRRPACRSRRRRSWPRTRRPGR